MIATDPLSRKEPIDESHPPHPAPHGLLARLGGGLHEGARGEVESGRLRGVRLKGMRIRRHFHVIHNEARTLSASARAFVDLLGASRIDGAKPGARQRSAS